ncbi:thioredoxin domain-containing protein 6 [Tachyglossus aculeatus]|uniref:thioredoxin domain-containing protein 6 n=1 Tax=Tachyglossus aculeatus TaxID=9261 RepID=UPI0018F62DA6|nr:thioredoxin domain-containing protein 6 [Tachyglossus aculeatus]
MVSKKKEITLQVAINSQELWEEMLHSKGLTVVDVYQSWCGPCKTVVSLFKKIKNELGDDLLHFAVAEADCIDALEKYRGKCEPTFLFYAGGELVAVVRGANAPVLQRTIVDQLGAEKKVLDQEAERKVIKDEALWDRNEMVLNDRDFGEQDETVSPEKSCTLAIIKPDAVAHGKMDEIITKIQEAGFAILANEERIMTESEAKEFYRHKAKEETFGKLVEFMSSGPCRLLIISRPGCDEDVVTAWRDFIGPSEIEIAKREHPGSLRAQYGTEMPFNAVHGSENQEWAERELAYFFPGFKVSDEATETKQRKTPQRTLALIRPGILKEKKEEILQNIKEAGFSIALQKEMTLTDREVQEFYSEQITQDHYPVLLQQMTSGPVLALALMREEAVEHWKALLGPSDLTEAVSQTPESFRARFSVEDVPINQIHGSSTPEEAQREISFFFSEERFLPTVQPRSPDEPRGVQYAVSVI